MPWSKDDYPASMKGLDPQTRDKAIEIANSLLEDGYEEGRAIAIAQSQAKESTGQGGGGGQQSGGGQGGQQSGGSPQHVVPQGDEWAIRKEGSQQATKTFDNKQEAEDEAKEMAQNQNTDLVIHDSEGNEQEHRNYT